MNKLIPIIGGIIVVVILFFVIEASIVTINAGNVGVKLTWGQADPTPLPPGLHFISPIGQSVYILSTHPDIQKNNS